MDVTVLNETADLIARGGLLAVCLLIFWSGYKQKWVWGHQHEDVIRDRDYWRDAYHRLAAQVDDEQRKTIQQLLQTKLHTRENR